jgi:hypothetical protein
MAGQPRPAGAGAQLGDDGAQARRRRCHGEHEDDELPLVLQGGAAADALDVGADHQLDCEHQVQPEADVPADEQAGGRRPARRDGRCRAHDGAEGCRRKQSWPGPHNARQREQAANPATIGRHRASRDHVTDPPGARGFCP